jgi:hypothetical protein
LTLSFSYNIGLLVNDALLGTDGSFYYSTGSEEQYYDYARDGAVSESLTINSQTFAMSSNFSNSLGRVEGGSNASGSRIDNSVFNLTELDSTYIYSIGQILSQNSVTAFVDSSDSGGVALSTDGPATLDVFNLQGVTVVSGMPEPATWISLALGIGALAALTRPRG